MFTGDSLQILFMAQSGKGQTVNVILFKHNDPTGRHKCLGRK